MAGQRMYYSNILTTTRGAVEVGLQIYVSQTLPIPSIVAGHGCTVVWYGQTTPSVAPTTAMAIYWPERFAASKITQLSADFNSGTTSQITGFINCLVVYTVPTSGPSYSVFQFVIPTTGTQLFVPASGTVFAYLEAEIGM